MTQEPAIGNGLNPQIEEFLHDRLQVNTHLWSSHKSILQPIRATAPVKWLSSSHHMVPTRTFLDISRALNSQVKLFFSLKAFLSCCLLPVLLILSRPLGGALLVSIISAKPFRIQSPGHKTDTILMHGREEEKTASVLFEGCVRDGVWCMVCDVFVCYLHQH